MFLISRTESSDRKLERQHLSATIIAATAALYVLNLNVLCVFVYLMLCYLMRVQQQQQQHRGVDMLNK